jgi:hypothetical protein
MSDTKQKRKRFTTPKGTAIFPWLNKPDTKFKAEGKYKVTLRLAAEDATALIEKLKPAHDAAVAAAKKNPKNKGKQLVIWPTHNPVRDDNGDETGQYDFNFSMTASGISKKTKLPWAMKPDLFDSRGEKLDPNTMVWGGSIIKVGYEVGDAYDKPIGVGIPLRLNAVQVIKLVSNERDAGMHGFGDESDDADADAPPSENATEDGEQAEGGEGDDF